MIIRGFLEILLLWKRSLAGKKNVRTRDIDDPIVEVFITAGKQAEEYLIDDNTVS